MVRAAIPFLSENQTALLALVFGLGIQAAVLSPLKYGILPEHLSERELVAGNGAVEATTFLSILLGTVAGGALILLDAGTTIVGATGLGVAVIGLFAALRIPKAPPANPSLKVSANIPAQTWRIVRQAASIRPVW